MILRWVEALETGIRCLKTSNPSVGRAAACPVLTETEDLSISIPVLFANDGVAPWEPLGRRSRERRSTPARGLRARALRSGKRDSPGAKTPLAKKGGFVATNIGRGKPYCRDRSELTLPTLSAFQNTRAKKANTVQKLHELRSVGCELSPALACVPLPGRPPVFPSLSSEGRLRLSNTRVRSGRPEQER